MEPEDVPLAVPPPPPPPPLPDSAKLGSADGPALPDSFLPPPPPLPPKPAAPNLGLPLPPPPPGPPPREQVAGRPPFLLPPPLQQSPMMLPTGTSEGEKERSQSTFLDDSTSKVPTQVISLFKFSLTRNEIESG